VPDLHSVFNLCGPISDHRHSGEPTTALQTLDSAAAPPTPPFRRTGQRNPRLIDRLVNRFGTQVPLRLAREAHRQLVGDPFGTPPLTQELSDDTMELLVTR
jgi:hypothetical protein